MIKQTDLVMLMSQIFGGTNLKLPGKVLGNVQEWYDLPDGNRLIVRTDKLSVFDHTLPGVPYKGQVLNQLSAWWFAQTQDIILSNIISMPDPNAALALNAEPLPVEVVVRGYITGVTNTALWSRYKAGEREIYGHHFPDGLRKNQVLPEPLITPTVKAVSGIDVRLRLSDVVDQGILDADTWDQIQAVALALFEHGSELASKAGLILVDTKYEFGRTSDGRLVLIDEIHTPDSSRFWKADSYEANFAVGDEPENFDKELVRKAYIERKYIGAGEPPALPAQLWAATSQRYIAIYEMLTGEDFEPGEYPVGNRLVENLRTSKII